MATVAADTIGGFNTFLKKQRSAPGTATITLNQFDHEFETIIANQNVEQAKKLNTETYVPRGMTALLDAVGRSINETGARLNALPEHLRPSKVLFVIITDGIENASKEYFPEQVKGLIEHQQQHYNWEFVFLGAKQDAILTARRYGIGAANAMTYAHTDIGTQTAFCSVADNTVAFRGGLTKSASFTASDRAKQQQAGAVA